MVRPYLTTEVDCSSESQVMMAEFLVMWEASTEERTGPMVSPEIGEVVVTVAGAD